jgi:transcriptional regulator with XRE-family HTH domain
MNDNAAGVRIDGARVRSERKLAGDNQVVLAEKADITPQYLSQIETGARLTVSPAVNARLCAALGLQDRSSLMATENAA